MPELYVYISTLIYIGLFIAIILTLYFLYKISKTLTEISKKMDRDYTDTKHN